jgi:osmotically-inducible protein OsmY
MEMSYLGRSTGMFGLALLMTVALAQVTPAVAGQVGAIKDGWLVMKVHSEMLDEDVLDGSNIDVDAKNGVVTLQGTVPSEAARARAIAVAKANDGVKNVVDQLKIAAPRAGTAGTMARAGDKAERAGERAGEKAERAGDKVADRTANAANKTGRKVDDGWIKSKIYAQYLTDWNTILDDSNIDVDVKDNVVTLNGTVKSNEAKTKAVAVAKATDGVKSVRDNLRVVATH